MFVSHTNKEHETVTRQKKQKKQQQQFWLCAQVFSTFLATERERESPSTLRERVRVGKQFGCVFFLFFLCFFFAGDLCFPIRIVSLGFVNMQQNKSCTGEQFCSLVFYYANERSHLCASHVAHTQTHTLENVGDPTSTSEHNFELRFMYYMLKYGI